MLLPEGIKRVNNKMFEEVVIPPTEAMPIGFEEKPVYISQLDEVSSVPWLCSEQMEKVSSHGTPPSIVMNPWWRLVWHVLACYPFLRVMQVENIAQ